jgi:hypothetical protein
VPAKGYISATGFARATLSGTLLVTLAAAALAWQWNASVAKGIVVGGVAGALGFWMMARSASTLTSIPKEDIPLRVYRWTFGRIVIYGLALYLAYSIGPVGNHALFGAAGGLFVARVVMLVAGIVAWRRGG